MPINVDELSDRDFGKAMKCLETMRAGIQEWIEEQDSALIKNEYKNTSPPQLDGLLTLTLITIMSLRKDIKLDTDMENAVEFLTHIQQKSQVND